MMRYFSLNAKIDCMLVMDVRIIFIRVPIRVVLKGIVVIKIK